MGLWKRIARACVFLFVSGVTILSTPLASDALIGYLQIFPAVSSSELASARTGAPTAIVILSAGRRVYAPEFGGETLDELSLERVRYGAALARQTNLPVLVSGGLGSENHPTLAALMAAALSKDYGIIAKWQEERSTTTAENAMYSSEMLMQSHISRVILVTHAWHMKRARAAFVANGLSVIPAPTAFESHTRDLWLEFIPSASALHMSSFAIHEILGREWYALRYGY